MLNVDFNNGDYIISISGDNFHDLVYELKNNKATWDKTNKVWQLSLSKYDGFIKDISYLKENVNISFLVEKKVQEYKESLKELELSKSRKVMDYSKMNYSPLSGKAPNENFQREDIRRAINQNRFLFNWEMGLGKSYALACLLTNLFETDNVSKAIIITSGIGTYNLKSELLKFCKIFDDNDIYVATNANSFEKKDDRLIFDKRSEKIFILSYESFKLVSKAYNDKKSKKFKTKIDFKKWLNNKDGILFLDEVHLLSNPKSERSLHLFSILPYFKYRYLFTGTLADKYEKLYTPCYILDKSLVNGEKYNDWLSSYNELGTAFSAYAINPNKWNIPKIKELNKELLEKYGTKRLMQDCLDLPTDYEHQPIIINMSDKQRKIYQCFINENLKQIKEKSEKGEFKNKVLNMFQYFQLSVDNPSCLLNSEKFSEFTPELQKAIQNFNYSKDYKKLEVVDDIIEEYTEKNEKGIIWYYHPATKEELIKRYEKYSVYVIEADMTNEKKFALIDKFEKDKNAQILIASINIMNTSVTLTECTWQVYLENTYNYIIYSQSRGRIHRPGQKTVSNTYFILYDNSIDNMQLENLRQKGELLNSLMNKAYISQTEWRDIFNKSHI